MKKLISYFKNKMREDYSKIIIDKIDTLIENGNEVKLSIDSCYSIYYIDKIYAYNFIHKGNPIIAINGCLIRGVNSLTIKQKEKIFKYIKAKYDENELDKINNYLK